MTCTRRRFLESAAAGPLLGRAASTADTYPLRPFAYSAVKLTGGPLEAMSRRLYSHFLRLDEDRLLKVYRQRAGLPAPGRDMGGWYDAEGFVPGHLLGQFLSGFARFSANRGEDEAAAKVRRLVRGYAAAFARDGNPFASRKAIDTWACYIFDKVVAGLHDAAALAQVDEARELLPRVIEAAQRYIPDHVFDRIGVHNPPYDEPYVLPESLFLAGDLTGDARFRDLARRYLLDDALFHPLAEGRNVLPGQHGYSHVIALSSAGKAYEVLGDARYLRAMRNAWDMLRDTQQYASGAWAPRETFVKPGSDELAASLTNTRDHFETPCCYYAHSKLARYLLRFTGESRYADGLEQVLFNTILGAIDPDDDGGYFYYSDYQAGARKHYYQQKWPCCAGTLMQSVADYPLNLYFHDDAGISVCLYAASDVRWRSVRLIQKTAYPESPDIDFEVAPDAPLEFEIRLRIPAWLDAPPVIQVNGKPSPVPARPGTFAVVKRRWRKGDRLRLRLPFTLRTVPIDARHPDTAAVMYGPLLLVAVDAPESFAVSPGAMRREGRTSLDFRCGAVTLRPFYQVKMETYTTYFRLARQTG